MFEILFLSYFLKNMQMKKYKKYADNKNCEIIVNITIDLIFKFNFFVSK